MVSRRRLQADHIPSEILWNELNGSSSMFGGQSCISSVTRELLDIDAPQLYPSIERVSEVPDLKVSSAIGSFEISSTHEPEEAQHNDNDRARASITRMNTWHPDSGKEARGASSQHHDLQRHRSVSSHHPRKRGELDSSSQHSLQSYEKPMRSHSLTRHFVAGGGLDGGDCDRRLQTQSSLSYHRSHIDPSDNANYHLSPEERRKSSQLLSNVRSSKHNRQEVRRQHSQDEQLDYKAAQVEASSPKKSTPTPNELGYESAASSPHRSQAKGSDIMPVPARRLSYNSAALSIQSKVTQDQGGEYEKHPSESSLARTPTLADAPPQRPQRRLSASSLREQYARHESCRDNPTTTVLSNHYHHDSNSDHHRRNTSGNNHASDNGTHCHPYHARNRSAHSGAALSRESQHSFHQESVQSDMTNPTFFDFIPSSYEQQPSVPQPPVEETPFRRNRTWCQGESDYHREKRDLKLEIQPGLFVRLRGSEETCEAMKCDFVMNSACFACSSQLWCIADAEYVLCPVCKVVSPIEHNLGSGGGVGLGVEP